MPLHKQFLLLLLLFAVMHGSGQPGLNPEDLYRDANSYFYFEDYEEALALYQRIYPHYPDNFNIDYRIGFCYLNIPGYRHHAITFLERAAENTTLRYSEQSLRETNAPPDAIFYLGNAYFINNELDKAEATYDRFYSLIRRQRQYDMDYYNHQRASINNSRTLQMYPVNFIRSNLGPNINDRFSNYNPVVSGDGKTLAYTTKRRFYHAIFVARREGDDWGTPQNITIDLVVDGNCQTLCLSYSGDELYLFKEHDHIGNIYVSNYVNGAWTPMRRLNDNINTHFYETHASVSADGRRLYFTSNRSGGYGGLDIYVSEREPGGDWGPPRNLGPTINTRFNENTPFIAPDGSTLFFSSEGHNTMGGYDIFFSQRQGDRWGPPINMGYPINTTDDDLFYHPIGDGAVGLMALFDNEGFGEMDIYHLEIFLPKYQRSIISSHEVYSRTTGLPKKTLIVDTLNFPGVALLDPSKPEHQKYLDPTRNYKLFFAGRSYDIRDQNRLIRPIDPTLAEQRLIERPAGLSPEHQLLSYDLAWSIMDSILATSLPADTLPVQYAEDLFDDVDTSRVVPWFYLRDEDHRERNRESVKTITSILKQLSSKHTRPVIEAMLQRSWEMPPSLLLLQASRLSRAADSLGISYELIGTFASLIDYLIAQQTDDATIRRARHISSQANDEEFFRWVQRILRDASPELAQLLEYIILNEPTVTDFSSLWEYLFTHKTKEIEPYISELLDLLARHSFEAFFNLSPEQQHALEKAIQRDMSDSLYLWILAIGVLGAFSVGLVVYKKRKRRGGPSAA